MRELFRMDPWRAGALAKLMLVGMVACLFVWLFVNNYRLSESSSTTRLYSKSYWQRKASFFSYDSYGFINGFNTTEMQYENMNVVCPCQDVIISSLGFTEFFTLNAAAAENNISRSKQLITDSASFCSLAQSAFWNKSNNVKIHLSESFCAAITDTLGEFLFRNESRGFVFFDMMNYYKQSFVNPVLMGKRALVITSISQVLNKLERRKDAVQGLGPLDYAAYNFVFNSFYDMLETYMLWYGTVPYYNGKFVINEDMPDDAFYHYNQQWSKALDVGATNTTIAWNLSFVVDIIWPAYFRQCDPPYCDITLPINVPRRFYLVFAELGGLVSIALFIVHALVWTWPSFLFDWTKVLHNSTMTRNEDEEEKEVLVSENNDNALSKK